jgi:hypothetical protein
MRDARTNPYKGTLTCNEPEVLRPGLLYEGHEGSRGDADMESKENTDECILKHTYLMFIA